MQTRPYPFDRLRKLTRQQLQSFRRLRALYDARQIAEALRVAGALLGSELTVSAAGAPELSTRTQLIDRLGGLGPSAFLLLEGGSQSLDAGVLIEVSAAFAERLVDRVLGGDAAVPLAPTLLPLDELGRGALSYLVARTLGVLRAELRLRHVTGEVAEVAAALGGGPFLACAFGVGAGADTGSVRVYAPVLLASTSTSTSSRRELGWVPLSLIALAGGCSLRVAELKQLGLRDVIVLDHSSLIFDGRRFAGHVMVHVAGSGTHLMCRTSERGLEVESLTSVKELQMTNGRLSQSPEPRATVPEVAADAPLELSVELARFTLTLGELQRTAPGDVLLTGRAIGELVTLRVAGTPLAEGELVDVEGEVGVRITRFLTTP